MMKKNSLHKKLNNDTEKPDVNKYNQLFSLVKNHMGWDDQKVKYWFGTSNLNLGGCSPADMIILGRAERLEQWIRNQIKENKSYE